MSDVVSIELLLDEATETRVRADWRRLADAGLSSLAAHTSPSNRPHITLLARPTLNPVAFTAVTARLPIPITLAEPIVFAHGERGVLAWRVALSAELRDLHAAVHAVAPAGDDASYTAPGSWTPHITIARRLRLESLPVALGLIGAASEGTGVSLRRWDSASAAVTAH